MMALACAMSREAAEDMAIVGGLVALQFVYAGNSLFLSYLMSIGIMPFDIVIFTAFATFLVLAPLSVYFERSKWPDKMSIKLAIQMILISFAGVTLFQSLFLKGIKLTSPAIATAMPNLAPGLIFLIAWASRLERVQLKCLYSKVKIIGTMFCIIGAVMMSFLHSTETKQAEPQLAASLSLPHGILDQEKIIGCLYLLSAVFVLSSNVVLQASALGEFPAPMSMCAMTSLIGVVITLMIEFVEDYKVFVNGWPLVDLQHLLGYSLLGGTVSGACVSFNGWAMKKRGPVLVSMFSPIGTVISVIMSVFTLGETISLGSLVGMCLMFAGLYLVLWAKGKEGFMGEVESGLDAEKSLLR